MYDDDWGEPAMQAETTSNAYEEEEVGRSSGKGRGFIVPENNNDDWGLGKKGFDSESKNDFGEYEQNEERGGWGNDNGSRERGGRGGRGRDGGRGGGRGGRGSGSGRGGSRGGFNRDTNNFGDFDRGGDNFGGRNQDRDSDNFGGRNRGGDNFGGRNRGADTFGGDDFGNNDDDRGFKSSGGRRNGGEEEDGEKPKEHYIPPDQPEDENVIYGSGVSVGINFDKYDSIEVKVTGENAPQPIDSFQQANLRSLVLENITKSGYTRPTPVQKHALPIVMGGRDLMACAQTGSGKTAAFAIPIINTLLDHPVDLVIGSDHCEPQVVIVSPTRELTVQIWQQMHKFALHSILKTVVAYGGTSVIHQSRKLYSGCHILVATPGRLLDFVDRGRVTFSSVRFLVLDEADRMLDMGFKPCIEKIVDHPTMVPQAERQTLMFSATFPDDVQQLASRFLNNYLFLAVGIVGGACTDVEQHFYEVEYRKKTDLLKDLVRKESDAGALRGTLIFVEAKKKADFIAAILSESKYPTTSIHGDRLQRQREEALSDFKSGKMSILVATGVASRGLDIKNVAHVINYDMPREIDEYVHRIGRTGRVGNRGRATSFYDPGKDSHLQQSLVRILKQAGQKVPDFLVCDGTRGYVPGEGNQFGGEDIRDFGGNGNPYPEEAYTPSAAEPDEAW